MQQLLLAGLTPDEILDLSEAELDQLIFRGKAIVFQAGTAEILGEFRRNGNCLTAELAHIDGGGEGVLPLLWILADRLAGKLGHTEVEWIVHAVYCANPNVRLLRVLELKGFSIREMPGIGKVYYFCKSLSEQHPIAPTAIE